MQENSDGMIELIETFQNDPHFFAVLSIPKHGERQSFRIGITERGYTSLVKILQNRPFDTMPGLKYRYFFTGIHGHGIAGIRTQLGAKLKEFTASIDDDPNANLVWLNSISSLAEAEYLHKM
jgi:hypothetical protein